MKKIILSTIAIALLSMSCGDFLDVDPTDRIPAEVQLSSDEGILSYMASIYNGLPIEDFRYDYREGFNYGGNSGGMMNANLTPDVIHSEWGDHAGQPERFAYWEAGYKYIREINNLQENIQYMKPSKKETLKVVEGEMHFFKAYTYFQLAKRYGGVSIIHKVQNFTGDYGAVKVPRSTEVETWNYVIAQCDSAIALTAYPFWSSKSFNFVV